MCYSFDVFIIMNKTFICLANSYKHGNRCIAGVEIEFNQENKSYLVKRDRLGNPIWFRPIHRYADAGAIPNAEAQSISILDIVEARNVEPHPEGAQCENFYYERLAIIARGVFTKNDLDSVVDRTRQCLFGNRGVAVHPDNYENLNYSILLIKTSEIEFYLKDRDSLEREPQPRGKLVFNGTEYDLPVTDPHFRQTIKNDLTKANSYTDYYLSISLGVEHEGWHSKLIAAVIICPSVLQATLSAGSNNDSGKLSRKEESAITSLTLFRQGLSIEEIASNRCLVKDTICSHLLKFVESGELSIYDLVSEDKILRVIRFKHDHPAEMKLKPFFDAFEGEIPYYELRWILRAYEKGFITNTKGLV